MQVTIVYDNEVNKEGLAADWGFSCLIETGKAPPILFDTGADILTLLHNMEKLNIDIERIRTIVISHPHMDHAGGLASILEINKDAEICLPLSFGETIQGRKVTIVTEPIQICEDVFSTGELNNIEQSLALKTDKGILVIVGCSHPGVGNILDAASNFGNVYGIVGGFHEFCDLTRLNGLSLICPCHCTQYKSEILQLFPQQCLKCGAGLVLNL